MVFYDFFFGVGFFVSRYFFPISPFLALVAVYWVVEWGDLLPIFGPLPVSLLRGSESLGFLGPKSE